MDGKKNCFVVMGFGTKTDLATGRKLNLDESYHKLIKPVIEGKGLVCVRADEIRHVGIIDVPMYTQLLSADVVVADISTANANALYELGVRHALRPRTTIVISENQLCYPFDLNHILITKYSHLGENIDYGEVLRFQQIFGETLEEVLKVENTDSPVYTFLSGLVPPKLQQKAEEIAKAVGDAVTNNLAATEDGKNETLAVIVKQAERFLKQNNYAQARELFEAALVVANCRIKTTAQEKATKEKNAENIKPIVSYAYLYHRLAFATYKSKQPDEISALVKAIDVLDDLDLQHTNDSETVMLAGKIEKRLYYRGQGDAHLANAILYYERAFFLLNSRYNGINLAFLLNNRVNTNLFTSKQDKIADMVLANRIRRTVLERCRQDWEKFARNHSAEKKEVMEQDNELAANQRAIENEQKFWILVNKAEAHFGLREIARYQQAREDAQKLAHQSWMLKVFDNQITKLDELLKQYGHLLDD